MHLTPVCVVSHIKALAREAQAARMLTEANI